MKVLVLGSGVIGITTAYYLARGGAEVTVVDRLAGPARQPGSFDPRVFARAGKVLMLRRWPTPYSLPNSQASPGGR